MKTAREQLLDDICSLVVTPPSVASVVGLTNILANYRVQTTLGDAPPGKTARGLLHDRVLDIWVGDDVGDGERLIATLLEEFRVQLKNQSDSAPDPRTSEPTKPTDMKPADTKPAEEESAHWVSPQRIEVVATGTDSNEYLELPPDPGVLLNSLRGIGYSFEDAISDVIDNSISAGATNIDLHIRLNAAEEVIVDVVDNGTGMDDAAMKIALTLGARERDPSLERAADDLGRFGLGLKTASFSVARRLTLYSRTGSFAGGRAWDLDDVRAIGRWRVSALTLDEERELAALLEGHATGTVVRWAKVDRLQLPKLRSVSAALMKLIERVRRHLGMVFHRFISGLGADGEKIPMIALRMGNRDVEPWNPLDPLIERPELIDLGEARYSHGLRAEHAILPPDTWLSADERKQASLEGHRMADMQGFYIYRANRLVSYASWLGLPGDGRRWNKEPSTQLARIAVDITNGSDEDWSLDVRKSKVVPPESDRQALIDVGNEARARSRQRIFGRKTAERTTADNAPLPPLWVMDGGLLRINRSHPLVETATKKDGADRHALVSSLLRQLEDSPTLVSMVAENAEARPVIAAQILDDTDMANVLALVNALRAGGVGASTILDVVFADPRYADPGIRERLRLYIEGKKQ